MLQTTENELSKHSASSGKAKRLRQSKPLQPLKHRPRNLRRRRRLPRRPFIKLAVGQFEKGFKFIEFGLIKPGEMRARETAKQQVRFLKPAITRLIEKFLAADGGVTGHALMVFQGLLLSMSITALRRHT